MSFLSLLLVYILHRRFNLTLGRQVGVQARHYQHWLRTRVPAVAASGWGLFALAVLLPSLALLVLDWLADDWLFGAGGLFLQILVLFLVLGCPLLKPVLEASLEDWQMGRHSAAEALWREIGPGLQEPARTAAEMHRRIRQEFLYQSFARYFHVIFWFMLLGAPMALLARLVDEAAESGDSEALREVAGRVNGWLQWLPARLLVGTFALAGNFSDCMRRGWQNLNDPDRRVRVLLDEAAEGALSSTELAGLEGADQSEARRHVAYLLALRDLLNRSILVWFAVLAALVLMGLL